MKAIEPALEVYLQEVTKLITLQQQLVQTVEAVVEVDFPPDLNSVLRGNTIREVIHNLNPATFMPPTATWIKPSKGIIIVQSTEWEFFFHGQGVSFKCVDTGQEVSVDYAVGGRIDATADWCVWEFISSSERENSVLASFSYEVNKRLFAELVKRGYLEPLPQFDALPEPLFVLAALLPGDGNC